MSAPASASLSVGTVLLGRYETVRELGAGGSATTYLVHDRRWDTDVALKLLRDASPELVEVLHTEFVRLRELSHPHLCQVHELGLWNEAERSLPFFTADYMPGSTLERYAEQGRWESIRRPLGDALEALDFLHRAGMLHGDFKPDNVLVDEHGTGTLIDLGCAWPMGSKSGGVVRGTRDYWAPEVLGGQALDARSDLYAVGVTLKRLATVLAEPLPKPILTLAERLVDPEPARRPVNVGELFESEWPERGRGRLVPVGLGRLVGRAPELESARKALDLVLARAKGPRILGIAGAPGLGKTRLLREIHWNARSRARVFEANSDAPNGIRALLEEAVGEVLPRAEADAALRARQRLVERGTPCVLLVDDAHRLSGSAAAMLAALARLLDPTDPVLLVVTRLPGFMLEGATAQSVELSPLTPSDVSELVGNDFVPATRASLHRTSGGHPAELRVLLLGLAAGSLNESDLVRGPDALRRTPGAVTLLDRFEPETRRALGILAAIGRPLGRDPLGELGVQPEQLAEPLVAGVAIREDAAYRLLNPRDADRVLDELGAEQKRAVELRVAEWSLSARVGGRSAEGGRSDAAAQAALHFARGGALERAVEVLLGHSAEHAMTPQAWLAAAQAIAAQTRGEGSGQAIDIELATARLEQMVGQAPAARERLEHLLATDVGGRQRINLRVELGACHLRLGNARESVLELRGALLESSSADEKARVADLLAQALCRQGAYEEAVRAVDQVLAGCVDPLLRADLDEAAGVAESSLGRFHAARARLEAAARVPGRSLSPRQLVRAHGVRALVAYQMGQLKEASHDYAEALGVAERHGLGDQLANAALNLGTVLHQRGAWAEALAHYERGLGLAVALGQTTTEAHGRLNLAKLYVDLGASARAERLLDSCHELAEEAGLSSVETAILALRAELALEQQGPEAACAVLVRALDLGRAGGDARDQAEIEIRLAELMLLAGDHQRAAEQVEGFTGLVASIDAGDVQVRAELARARLLNVQHRLPEAVSRVEEARTRARGLELADLEAEAELMLGDLWRAQGSDLLASKHRLAAREIWERDAAMLSPELRDGFWRCRRRSAVLVAEPNPTLPEGTPREHKFRQLVDIFRRLNSSLKTEDVLRRAMDAAIELTGAERGFLLRVEVQSGQRTLGVAVARNVDREQLEHSHSKFSRAIAEQVVSSGQPVVTACAQTDQRFDRNESVHALRLQSVVCVPVTSPAGCLGALYLDNRFKSHGFSEPDVDLVLAFADQVAIALGNATLHQELQRKNRELLAQSKRIEELLRDKEAEVERLTEQVERRSAHSTHRYDYSAIVGSSPMLERVFDLLDRVIETDLTVLIEGESGTGKELVARAIHANCSARRGPLVSINCAALPEPLLEAELFGYTRGAFTGANTSRDGLFVQARGGTLFLDELGEMPQAMQVKLLRVLQEREVRPLGATRTVPIDVRLVCATNRHLATEVAQGRFREDLYYRVGAVALRLPALRERPEDLPVLVDHLLRLAGERMHRPVPQLSRPALAKLSRHSWPGNVRQLENVLTRALVMAQGGRIAARDVELSPDSTAQTRPLDRERYAQHESALIAEALGAHQWNIAKAAQVLKVSRPTLYRRMKAYGLGRKR